MIDSYPSWWQTPQYSIVECRYYPNYLKIEPLKMAYNEPGSSTQYYEYPDCYESGNGGLRPIAELSNPRVLTPTSTNYNNTGYNLWTIQ